MEKKIKEQPYLSCMGSYQRTLYDLSHGRRKNKLNKQWRPCGKVK